MLGQANKFQDLAYRQYLNNNNNKIEEDIKVINISKIVKKKIWHILSLIDLFLIVICNYDFTIKNVIIY